MATKIFKVGKRVKGGGQNFTLDIDGDLLEVTTDPKQWSEPVAQALLVESIARIKAIHEQPARRTRENRGPGKLFNVTGKLARLRLIFLNIEGGTWSIFLGRPMIRSMRNRLNAIAKLGLQSLLKNKKVEKAVQKDVLDSVINIIGSKRRPRKRRSGRRSR